MVTRCTAPAAGDLRSAGHALGWSAVTERSGKTFDDLYAELSAKVAARDPGSSTVARVEAGVHEIGKKIIEEAAEVWMAAEHQGKDDAALEISQLLYHLQVLMLALELDLDDVYAHL